MTVGELKNLLKGIPDDTPVLLPYDMSGFDGAWLSACEHDSGMSVLHGSEDDEQEDEIKAFVLVPHEFFEEPEFNPELN